MKRSQGLFCVCTAYFAGAYAKFVNSEVSEDFDEFPCSQFSMIF